MEDDPGRGGWWETDEDVLAVVQGRGRRSPSWNGVYEDGSQGKWVEETVIRFLRGGSQQDVGAEGGI